MKTIYTILILSFLGIQAIAQPFPGGKIEVIHNGNVLKNAWAGGLDMPQFSGGDINADGKNDLMLFDKKSNKFLLFLNNGQGDYIYAPQYEPLFPTIKNMALFRDYNCDGKPDIFAHTNRGIQVFKNTFENGNPSFEQVKSLLEYQASFGANAIYKYNLDIVAIEDFDGDGDIDILSFDLLGTTIPYYRNLSVEQGFDCDSLIFEENTTCWGNFRESGSSSNIELNYTCKGGGAVGSSGKRHTGSTLLAFDPDQDNDKDVLIGDVAYDSLTYLKNGGTNLLANMVAIDNEYPSYDSSVAMPNFPAGFYVDANDDGKKDLLISPNEYTDAVNQECVWFYENTGNLTRPFRLVQKDFLVNTQIDNGSYSYATFFDHNADGLQDMIVAGGFVFNENKSTTSALYYYENIGTATAPKFELKDNNYANFSNFNLEFMRPTFGDLDADGDQDMFLGEINGYVHYFENTAGAGNTAQFSLHTPQYAGIDIGTYSHPQLVDLNEDGLLDLIVGRSTPIGNIAYYKNIGTSTAFLFHKDTVNETLGNIHVEDPGFLFGYSAPFVAPKESNGKRYIYVGSDLGNIHQYEINIDSLNKGSFAQTKSAIFPTKVGKRTTIYITDINGDDAKDYFIGNARGGVSFYSDVITDSTLILNNQSLVAESFDFALYPNPAQNELFIQMSVFNKDTEVFIYNTLGKKIWSKTLNQPKEKIDISHWAKGIYFIQVNSKGKVLSKKWLKQ